jgi:hypothetical protein
MKTKHGILSGFAVLLVAAIFSLSSCGDGADSGGGGGTVPVPTNLQNTKWKHDGTTTMYDLEFTTDTVTRTWDTSKTYTIASAVENGAIVLNDPNGGTVDFSTSYVIDTTKSPVELIITGGTFNGTRTKI